MNEKDVLTEIKQGNTENFSFLLTKYHNMIYKIINSLNINNSCYIVSQEDLYQEASMALYEASLAFDDTKGMMFSSFAYLVMKRRLLNKFNSLSTPYRYEIISTDSYDFEYHNLNDFNDKMNDPAVIYRNKEYLETILDFINKQSKEDQEILRLRTLDYKYKDISQMLNINTKKIDNRIYRLRKSLNNYLKKLEEIDKM